MRAPWCEYGAIAVAVALLTTACSGTPSAQAQAPQQPAAVGPWEVVFKTSGSPAAQEHFLSGMVQMHLFMYPDAAAEFRKAQEADPGFAMAYWGEALTHYQPIWREYDRDAGRAVMQRLGATTEARLAKASTPREKDYVATLDVLYGDGDRPRVLRAYANAMEELVARYPDDEEALAMWAVSRVVQYERTDADLQERMRTAGIAQELLRRRPRHPGAPRYLIQSVDDPIHADLGTIAAQIYVDTAPDSPEARHVPTHIDAQLGRWKQMAELNRQAFDLSMAWTKRHGYKLQELNNHDYGHLLTYEQYGYLQLGQYGRARQIIDRVRQDYEASGKAPEIASTLTGTMAQYIVETSDRDQLAALRQLVDSTNVRTPSIHYAIGLVSARLGDIAVTKQSLAAIGGQNAASGLMRAELQALTEAAGKNDARALELLRTAAAADLDQIFTHFGPPVPFKPPHELYGEMLLAAKRPAEALTAFQEGLRIYRGRTTLLAGASRAAAVVGNAALAKKYAVELRKTWADADTAMPALVDITQLTQ